MVFVDETWFTQYILNDLCLRSASTQERCIAQIERKLQKMFTEQCAKGSISKDYFNGLLEAVLNRKLGGEVHMLLSLDNSIAATIESHSDVNTRIRLFVDGALQAFLFWEQKKYDEGHGVPGPHAYLLLLCAKPQLPPRRGGKKPPPFGPPLVREFIQRVKNLGYTDIFLSRLENITMKDNEHQNNLKGYYEKFGFQGDDSTTEMRLTFTPPSSNKRPREEDLAYEEPKLPRLADASPPMSPNLLELDEEAFLRQRSKPQPSQRRLSYLPDTIDLTHDDDDSPPMSPNLLELSEETFSKQRPKQQPLQKRLLDVIDLTRDDDKTPPMPPMSPNLLDLGEEETGFQHYAPRSPTDSYMSPTSRKLSSYRTHGVLRGGGGNIYFLGRSWRRGKKYVVVAHNSRTKTNGPPIHFGDVNTPNFTQHHNTKLRDEYLQRQQRRGAGGPATPQFWDRWILWNKPTKRESIRALERALHAEIRPF